MRHCYVLSVFTSNGQGGNPLGVIPDTTGLDGAAMQAIAGDLLFEVAFVDWKSGGMPLVRIFTGRKEIPFGGHSLVGVAYVLNQMGPGANKVMCSVGEVAMAFDPEGVWIAAPEAERPVREMTASVVELAGSFGLPAGEKAWLVEVPSRLLLIRLPEDSEVAAVRPDLDVLRTQTVANGIYVFARHGEHVHSRLFAPGVGVNEDPASGSAAVALAELLREQGESAGSLAIEQGEEMGAPSLIRVRWSQDRIEIGGNVRSEGLRVLDV